MAGQANQVGNVVLWRIARRSRVGNGRSARGTRVHFDCVAVPLMIFTEAPRPAMAHHLPESMPLSSHEDERHRLPVAVADRPAKQRGLRALN